MRKIKRRRVPGVGFEPTRSAQSQISGKRPDHRIILGSSLATNLRNIQAALLLALGILKLL